jgi:hypothetical protein
MAELWRCGWLVAAGLTPSGNRRGNNEAGGVIYATGATPLVIDTGSNKVMNAG